MMADVVKTTIIFRFSFFETLAAF